MGQTPFDTALQSVRAQLAGLTDNQAALLSIRDQLAANIQKEQTLMSQITDWATAEQADLTAISSTLDGIVTGIANLDALITAFQNSPGTLSATDQAALDGIQAAGKALLAKAQAISVTAPTTGSAPPAPPRVGTPVAS